MGTNKCEKAVKSGRGVSNSGVTCLLKAKAGKTNCGFQQSSHTYSSPNACVRVYVLWVGVQQLFIFFKPFVRSPPNCFPGLCLEFSATHSQDF